MISAWKLYKSIRKEQNICKMMSQLCYFDSHAKQFSRISLLSESLGILFGSFVKNEKFENDKCRSINNYYSDLLIFAMSSLFLDVQNDRSNRHDSQSNTDNDAWHITGVFNIRSLKL